MTALGAKRIRAFVGLLPCYALRRGTAMLKWVLVIGHGLHFNCLGWSGCLLICFQVVVQRWVTPDLSVLKSVGEHAARSFEV